MPRLFIPTRNRPTSLLSVVTFLERFYPGTALIVADGSSDAFADRNREAMTAPGRKVDIEYRRYPYEFGFFDRILDVLENIDDPNIIMGSDDDYPLMDVLAAADAALMANPAASTAMGALLYLRLDGPDELNSRLSQVRPIQGTGAVARMRGFAQWSFPTTYAVTRREHLIERYRRAREVFLLGFFDFSVGLQDCAAGEIIALPDFGYISTHNYNHSYLRPGSKMLFVRRPDDLARIKGFIAHDLVVSGGLGADAAEAEAASLLRTRATEYTGRINQPPVGFERDPLFLDPLVRAQFALFRDVFRPGTRTHARFAERLGVIRDALVATAHSADNSGEPLKLRTLSEQRDAPVAAGDEGEARTSAWPTLPGGQRKVQRFALYDPARMTEGVDPATMALIADPQRELVVLALGGPSLAGPPHTALAQAVRDGRAGAPVGADAPGVWGALAGRIIGRHSAGFSLASLTHDGPIEAWGRGGPALATINAALPSLVAADRPPRFIVWHIDARHQTGPVAIEQSVRAFADLHRAITAVLPEATWLICRGAGAGVAPAARERIAQISREILKRCVNTRSGPDFDHLTCNPADPALAPAVAGLIFDRMRAILAPAEPVELAALAAPVAPAALAVPGAT